MDYQPLVIIGAPRSGTNMLRDVLTKLDGVATWPCDEINYIWRHGNIRYPSDEIPPENATEPVKRYIRSRFGLIARRNTAHTVVEKTCANSLRVPFVDAVVPDAQYIFIRRDGLDSVGSAMKRWTAALDIPYLARKARFVPLSDLPYYGSRYLWNRIYRLFSREDRLAFWGPQLADMESLLQQHSLDEVCALQWKNCVEKAADAFDDMPPNRWLEIKYEDFVTDPSSEMERIVSFAKLDVDCTSVRAAVSGVRSTSMGKGRTSLDAETTQRLVDLVGQTLSRYGYS